MWSMLPGRMCDQHLLGEHLEMHMFAKTINKGKSIQGYIDRGLVIPNRIKERHEKKRGMNHSSPIIPCYDDHSGYIDPDSDDELLRRCERCRRMVA